MISSPQNKFEFCETHNLNKELILDESNQSQKFVCSLCIQQEQVSLHNQGIYQLKRQKNQKILNHLLISFQQVKQEFIKHIEILESIIRNQISEDENEIKKLSNTPQFFDDIRIKNAQYIEQLINLQEKTKQELLGLNKIIGIEKLIQTLNELDLEHLENEFDKMDHKITQQSIQNQTQQVEQSQRVRKYQYELLPYHRIKQEQQCCDIAFNQDGSIVITGCNKNIRVFEFKNEQLQQIQQLEGHKDNITVLLFMKKSNKFISGAGDGQIKIWATKIKQMEYVNILTLCKHNSQINCLIINSIEDLIISGSADTQIKFWRSNTKDWLIEQSIKCHSDVLSLSLNHSDTKLISCGCGTLISVFEQQGKNWIITQRIDIQISGQKLCFINDDQFAFIKCKDNYIHFYKFNYQKKEFRLAYEVKLDDAFLDNSNGFPAQFIKSKSLLIFKSYRSVYILSQKENNKFNIDQTIKFQYDFSYGSVSENGQFFITWDAGSQEYHIRKLKEILQQ